MSYTDSFDPEDYEGLQEKSRNIPVRQIKEWQQQSKRLAELEAKEAARERTAALAEAGIPAEFGALFRDDAPVESLKAAFEKFGGPSAPNAVQQSLAGHAAAQQMSSGAPNASQSGTAAELQALIAKSRLRTDWRGGSAKENAELNALLAREGVDPNLRRLNTADWRLPGQLASG